MWVQKISIPHKGWNWKFWSGWGSKTLEIPEGQGLDCWFSFQMSFDSVQMYLSSCPKILSYLQSRSFTWNYLNHIIFEKKMFPQKALWNQVQRTCFLVDMGAITCYQSTWSHFMGWEVLVTSCQSNSFMKISFTIKEKKMKLENFLFLFISDHLHVIFLKWLLAFFVSLFIVIDTCAVQQSSWQTVRNETYRRYKTGLYINSFHRFPVNICHDAFLF